MRNLKNQRGSVDRGTVPANRLQKIHSLVYIGEVIVTISVIRRGNGEENAIEQRYVSFTEVLAILES